MSGFVLNFYTGWSMVLAAFLSGAGIGLFFHREDFLGGYTSLPRRMLRLGHIALAALGLMNVVFASCVPGDSPVLRLASICFIVGGLTMPAVCFLTTWRKSWRHAFVLPVLALVLAVILVLVGATP